MDYLRICIEKLNGTNSNEISKSSEIYTCIANIEISNKDRNEFEEGIVPQLYDLFESGKIRKDIFFLSLLANSRLLKIFFKYEESIVRLDFNNPKSIFNYIYYKNEHWLFELINNVDKDFSDISPLIKTSLFILKIVWITNISQVNIEELSNYLERDYSQSDSFLKRYIDSAIIVSKVTNLINNSSGKGTQIFQFLCKNTLLSAFSHYIDISNSNSWNGITHILMQNENFNKKHFAYLGDHELKYSEVEVFIAFTILVNVINCLKFSQRIGINGVNKDEITATVETIKEKLINMPNRTLQIELLENIFVLIFLRNSDIKNEKVDIFFCGEPEIRLILSLLKSIFEDLKKKYSDRTSNEFKRFVNLNKYVADGYWRLELLNCVKKKWHLKKRGEAEIKDKDILHYMLSSPEALINMCLKQNNIEKAIQVVKIFGLEQSKVSKEIQYSIAIADLRSNIQEIHDKKHKYLSPTGLLNKHFDSHQSLINNDVESESHFSSQKAIDTFDILLTVPIKYPAFKELVEIIDDEFHDKALLPPIFHRLMCMECDNYYPINEVLLSCNSTDVCKFDNDFKLYVKLAELYDHFQIFYNRLDSGNLNFNHPLHKILIEIQEACIAFKGNSKESVQYMQKLLKYLKALYKILLLEQNNTDLVSKGYEVSLLEILKQKRVDLISKLIYERNLDGVDFDHIFGKMKLDLTYHVAASSFPKVNLNMANVNPQNAKLFKPRKDVVNYIRKRNWLLAFTINIIHGIEDEKIDSNEIRIRTLGNLMRLKDIQNLKVLFKNSEILTVLQQDFSTYITDEGETVCVAQNYYPVLLKTSEATNWKHLYELILSISDNKVDKRILKFRDLILCNLVKSRQESDFYKYVRFITNRNIRIQIILEEFFHWPDDFCIDIIKSESYNHDLDNSIFNLNNWCMKIEVYLQIKGKFSADSWFEIHQLCESNVDVVLDKILEARDVNMLINFLDIHSPEDDQLLNIDSEYFALIFNQRCSHEKIKILLKKLPEEHFLQTCRNLLKRLRNLEDLTFILNCIKENSNSDELNIKNIEISLRIMSFFTIDDQHQFFYLMDSPLSILEMLLMNTKLEKLAQILQGIQTDINVSENDDNVISISKIDELLRKYAEKSLDFKIVARPTSNNQSESKIMLSIDSLCLEQKVFVMPEKVPTKEEWISDDDVTECMCCYQITFSMFNRRHHCRRCGQVICWNCSLQKMHVETYGDILVRVCKDCFKQSRCNASDSDSVKSERSRIDEYWTLTDNIEHNTIVREEFAYENAPSVLLCLSILKYHSKTELCPQFLLNQCENILKILHPVGSTFAEEIDFSLIINMLKSLAVAAKMISNQCMLQWGASLADKMISQAEMLGLLAEKGYLHLISIASRSQNIHIDANVLRHVRDKLLELEQWHLALEVSTKAGLDTTGVFAKWGKSFLKAGNLQFARLKFHMCFEKCAQYETPDYGNLHESCSSLKSNRSLHQSKLSLIFDAKPLKSPLLLNEIVQILESKSERINPKTFKNLQSTKVLYDSTSSLQSNPNTAIKNEDSILIMNKLQNLNAIANGNYVSSEIAAGCDNIYSPHLENIFYEECIYYLDKYGSHLSLCQFYIRHNDFSQALEYIADNNINWDVFIEIYMSCLKDGKINYLQEYMIKIDSTLDTWKDYIRYICVYLEKQSMLHSLYQLQQFIGDYVRAAMTCIKFYSHEVTCFEEFSNRVEYLLNAEEHLRQELEQEQWVDVQSVSSKRSDIFEEKSITNPALVMKLSSKDIKKHINTIQRQMEIVNFLTECERSGISVNNVLTDIQLPNNSSNLPIEIQKLPTLFGSIYEKMQLATLCIVSGENVEDGFQMAYRIIQDYKLKAVKIYCQSGRLLAKMKRHSAVLVLVKCIRSGGENDAVVTEMCDEMLALTARTLGDYNATDKQLEDIIKHISNRAIKINSYIETKQLRSAFLLAAKFSRIGDIRRISREAELYNRPDVKKLCQKYLQIQEHTTPKNEN